MHRLTFICRIMTVLNTHTTSIFQFSDVSWCLVRLPQGLFYRVVGGEVSPFRLVRLSAEEMASKEISEWRKSDAPEVSLTSF